jgi:hypothetical protein
MKQMKKRIPKTELASSAPWSSCAASNLSPQDLRVISNSAAVQTSTALGSGSLCANAARTMEGHRQQQSSRAS